MRSTASPAARAVAVARRWDVADSSTAFRRSSNFCFVLSNATSVASTAPYAATALVAAVNAAGMLPFNRKMIVAMACRYSYARAMRLANTSTAKAAFSIASMMPSPNLPPAARASTNDAFNPLPPVRPSTNSSTAGTMARFM